MSFDYARSLQIKNENKTPSPVMKQINTKGSNRRKKKSHKKEKLIALCESSVQSREVLYEMKTPTRFSFVLMLADSMDPIVFLKCLISWAFLFLKKRKVLRKLTYNLEMHCHVNIRRVFSSFIQGKIKWALSYTIRDNPVITSKLQSFTVFEYGT